jgi:ketosteroid isomerase-like protein
MKTTRRNAFVSALFATLCWTTPAVAAGPAKTKVDRPEHAAQQVQAAFDKYIEAWRSGNMDAFAASYTNDDRLTAYWPDHTRTYPIKGWNNVRTALQEIVNLIGGMDLIYNNREVEVYGNIAILTADWRWVGIGSLREPMSDKAQKVYAKGRGTFVFERQGSKWVVVHEHSSVLSKI